MKKIFEDDSSYIEINKNKTGNLIISLCAKDPVKEDQVVMISVEMSKEDLLKLVEEEEKE